MGSSGSHSRLTGSKASASFLLLFSSCSSKPPSTAKLAILSRDS
jgi:hypothetical protein